MSLQERSISVNQSENVTDGLGERSITAATNSMSHKMLSNMIILWHSVPYQAVISKYLTDFDLVSLVSCLYLTFIGNDQDSLFSLIIQ